MKANRKREMPQREREYYETVKSKMEELLTGTFSDFYLEVTAQRKFSNRLKAQISPHGERDIVFHFLRETAPDITGFIRSEYASDVIVVEIKAGEVKVDDIYQTKKYAQLFKARFPGMSGILRFLMIVDSAKRSASAR